MTLAEFCIKYNVHAREIKRGTSKWRSPHKQPAEYEIQGKLFFGQAGSYRIMRFYTDKQLVPAVMIAAEQYLVTIAVLQELCIWIDLSQLSVSDLAAVRKISRSEAIWLATMAQRIALKVMIWLDHAYDDFYYRSR